MYIQVQNFIVIKSLHSRPRNFNEILYTRATKALQGYHHTEKKYTEYFSTN